MDLYINTFASMEALTPLMLLAVAASWITYSFVVLYMVIDSESRSTWFKAVTAASVVVLLATLPFSLHAGETLRAMGI